MNELKRISTGYFVAFRNDVAVACIASEHGDGAIAQHSSRVYEAVFRPNPKDLEDGTATHRGSLSSCKKWIVEMFKVRWDESI